MNLRLGRRLATRLWSVSAIGLALALAPCCRVTAAEEARARSGHFGSLTLAVTDEIVTGVFAERRGEASPGGAPAFSCIFLLRGRLAGAGARVETWYPGETDRIQGTLSFTSAGAALKLSEDHGGCPMTTGSMVGHPYILPIEPRESGDLAESWQGVGLVTARRALLQPEPGSAKKRGSYLVANDPIVILERRDGWIRTRYFGGKTAVAGWLSAGDLAIAAR